MRRRKSVSLKTVFPYLSMFYAKWRHMQLHSMINLMMIFIHSQWMIHPSFFLRVLIFALVLLRGGGVRGFKLPYYRWFFRKLA